MKQTLNLDELAVSCNNLLLQTQFLGMWHASSMPYMSMYIQKKKNAHKSAQMKRSMLQACHHWKEVCYKHATCVRIECEAISCYMRLLAHLDLKFASLLGFNFSW